MVDDSIVNPSTVLSIRVFLNFCDVIKQVCEGLVRWTTQSWNKCDCDLYFTCSKLVHPLFRKNNYGMLKHCLLMGDRASVFSFFHLIFRLCLISYRTTGTWYFNNFDPLVNQSVKLLGNGDNFLRISQIHSWTCSRNLNKVEILKKIDNGNEAIITYIHNFFGFNNSLQFVCLPFLTWLNCQGKKVTARAVLQVYFTKKYSVHNFKI